MPNTPEGIVHHMLGKKHKCEKIEKEDEKDKMYATIKRGKVEVPIGSKQFKYLMWKKLPVTVVKEKGGKKTYERLNV